jgi:hypothetical protein
VKKPLLSVMHNPKNNETDALRVIFEDLRRAHGYAHECAAIARTDLAPDSAPGVRTACEMAYKRVDQAVLEIERELRARGIAL